MDALTYTYCLGCAVETWCTYHDGFHWYCCQRCHNTRPLCQCEAAEYVAMLRSEARAAGQGVQFAKEFGRHRRAGNQHRYGAMSAAFGALIAMGWTYP